MRHLLILLALLFSTSTLAQDETPDSGLSGGHWQISEAVSPFTDRVQVLTYIGSHEPVGEGPAREYAVLVVGCTYEGEFRILVGTRMPLANSWPDDPVVDIRFDREPAFELRMLASNDNESLVFPDPDETLRFLEEHDTLLLGWRSVTGRRAIASFDLRGLTETLKNEPRALCRATYAIATPVPTRTRGPKGRK